MHIFKKRFLGGTLRTSKCHVLKTGFKRHCNHEKFVLFGKMFWEMLAKVVFPKSIWKVQVRVSVHVKVGIRLRVSQKKPFTAKTFVLDEKYLRLARNLMVCSPRSRKQKTNFAKFLQWLRREYLQTNKTFAVEYKKFAPRFLTSDS